MSKILLSGLAFAVLMTAVATPSAAAEAKWSNVLVQEDAGQLQVTKRRTKSRVKTSDIVIVKEADASSPK